MKYIRSFMKKHTMGAPVLLLIFLFTLETIVSINVSRSLYHFVEYPSNLTFKEFTLTSVEEPDRDVPYAEVTEVLDKKDYVQVKLTARERGAEQVKLDYIFEDESGKEVVISESTLLTVTGGVVFLGEKLADFTGFPLFFYTMALYALLMLGYLEWQRRQLHKETLYSHRSVIHWSGTFFFSGIFAVYGLASMIALMGYRKLHTAWMVMITQNLMFLLVGFTFPFLFVFSIFLIVSNLALMKHEGKRPANGLGIMAGICLMLGDIFVFLLYLANLRYGTQNLAIALTYALSATMLVIFQMLLSGSIVCGFLAATHKPNYDKDYIIILGCAIRKDGTLYPLIRGRVDRAIAFFREQLEKTGKKAIFVPSGGQGSDEVMAEGAAMRNYLIEQGIPAELIMAETESATTLENMRFSKKLIEERAENASIAYSTTNYHVFRSGIFATQAGLRAEGMGAHTVWYFWPNAFLREVAALFVSHPKRQLIPAIMLAMLAGLSGYWRYLMF